MCSPSHVGASSSIIKGPAMCNEGHSEVDCKVCSKNASELHSNVQYGELYRGNVSEVDGEVHDAISGEVRSDLHISMCSL